MVPKTSLMPSLHDHMSEPKSENQWEGSRAANATQQSWECFREDFC
jgi:hypothetical protein